MSAHLSKDERDLLARYRCQGFSQVEIAKLLNRSPSTISRELKRNAAGKGYYASHAQTLAAARRRQRPLVKKLDQPSIKHAVNNGLALNWSPEQIAGRLSQQHPDDPRCQVSPQTIRTWIKTAPNRKHLESHLRRRGKRPYRRKTPPNREAARIKNRPEIIELRSRRGDFEGDTVLGRPGTGGLLTLVDRLSRFTLLKNIDCKEAEHVKQRLAAALEGLDAELLRSVTFDNGTEFAYCDQLEKRFEIVLYYADPGCPYQRGTNENTNGLLRQFFPKGMDFRTVTPQEVRRVQDLINHRPRRCLDFQTPHEVFYASTNKSTCD